MASYTNPNAYSTPSATITTRADMINPCIMGRMPDFFRLPNEVFSPMAAKAQTIRNLLIDFEADTMVSGILNMLAIIAIPRKHSINQGKIFTILTFALILPMS